MMQKPRVITVCVGQMNENCHICIDPLTDESVIIDPGDEPDYISQTLEKHKLTPVAILATHGHFDHVMASFALQALYNIPFIIHEKDVFLLASMRSSARHFLGVTYTDPPPQVSRTITDETVIELGSLRLGIIQVPGHTPGGISFYDKQHKILFSGDILFNDGSVGRSDFSYSNAADLRSSVKKILSLHPDTILYSGHGESSTVKHIADIHRNLKPWTI